MILSCMTRWTECKPRWCVEKWQMGLVFGDMPSIVLHYLQKMPLLLTIRERWPAMTTVFMWAGCPPIWRKSQEDGESAKKRRQEEKESKESKSTILQLQQLSQSLPTAGSNKSHLHAPLLRSNDCKLMGTSPKCLSSTIEVKVEGGIGGSGNLNIKGQIEKPENQDG